MHFFAFLLTALRAGAHALPAANAILGGDLSSAFNTSPHNIAIATFLQPKLHRQGSEKPSLSFPAAGCYPFDSASDTVGINWGSDSNCGSPCLHGL
ncbi:MAG: hypothetical protein Q9161_000491 [Pseudevernia consocians]